jgi:uncharacterized protein YPO0396
MPMMIEAQFLALTNRASVQWTREFQQHLNNSTEAISQQMKRVADGSTLTDENSSRNLTKAAGPMAPAPSSTQA